MDQILGFSFQVSGTTFINLKIETLPACPAYRQAVGRQKTAIEISIYKKRGARYSTTPHLLRENRAVRLNSSAKSHPHASSPSTSSRTASHLRAPGSVDVNRPTC